MFVLRSLCHAVLIHVRALDALLHSLFRLIVNEEFVAVTL